MLRQVGIEGIDGAGKTSVADRLEELLKEDGLKVSRFSPFRMVRGDTYGLWKTDDGAHMAIDALRTVFRRCDEQAQHDGSDVAIYDRHWMTAFTEIADRSALVEAWGDAFIPTALIAASPESATARLSNDGESEWSRLDAQKEYAQRYHRLALGHYVHMLGIYRNDGDVTIDMIARSIRSDMYYRR